VTDTAAPKKREIRFVSAIVTYFRQTRAELRKVTWPTRREWVRLTAIVLGVTFVMAAFLGLIDYVLTVLFGLIL
jgi:preprotein translocase subunit SecE